MVPHPPRVQRIPAESSSPIKGEAGLQSPRKRPTPRSRGTQAIKGVVQHPGLEATD